MTARKASWRAWLAWVLWAMLALQLVWVCRIGFMAWVMPSSTAMQRSEWVRLWRSHHQPPPWRHTSLDHGLLPDSLRRAVMASEDSRFLQHSGVDWEASWAALQINLSGDRKGVLGGSTITQQLAKNLFLSGERHIPRKLQELVIAVALEGWLTKAKILDLYLNHVEWGEGVFGAEAAARSYFKQSAWTLNDNQAARLAVMLPSPKRFEDRPASGYLMQRSGVIRQRMQLVDVPKKEAP
ncbi:MAG: hypothetical protein RL357_1730 [Pseudomonadota bacterium]